MKKVSLVLAAALALVFSTGLVFGGGGAQKDSAAASNTVVVYNCNTDDWTAPIVKAFTEQTGIKVELVAGGSGEIQARVRAESGNALGDIMWGGTADSYLAMKEYLHPYVSSAKPFIVDGFVIPDDSYYNVTLDPYAIAYNTDQLKPGETPPTKWADLFDPKWKGRISIADPAKSSSTYTMLAIMMNILKTDTSMIPKLIDNLDNKIASGSAAQIKALADGEYAITATFEEAILKYVNNGAHMKIVYPEEGNQLSSGCIGIIKGAKNLENAKKFLDFAMSKEVHQNLEKTQRRSSRSDIVTTGGMVPLSSINFTAYDTTAGIANKDKTLQVWRDYVTK